MRLCENLTWDARCLGWTLRWMESLCLWMGSLARVSSFCRAPSSRPDQGQQRLRTKYVHGPSHVVGRGGEAHLPSDLLQSLQQEVSLAERPLYGPEGVLCKLNPRLQLLWLPPRLRKEFVDDTLMLPPLNRPSPNELISHGKGRIGLTNANTIAIRGFDWFKASGTSARFGQQAKAHHASGSIGARGGSESLESRIEGLQKSGRCSKDGWKESHVPTALLILYLPILETACRG